MIQKGARPLVLSVSDAALPPNMTVFAAAGSEEITGGLDEHGYGIFTYYLLKGIYAGIGDSQKLCDYLKQNVADAAARQNRNQTPVCSGLNIDGLR